MVSPVPAPSSRPVSSKTRYRRLRPSTFWSIRHGIPGWLKLLMPLLGAGIPILLWSIFSYAGIFSEAFFPTPVEILQAGYKLLSDGILWGDILASAGRVLAGFLAAAIVSIPIGLLMGTFHTMEGLFSPVVSSVRYMPVAAFVPLVVIWFGYGEPAKILIVFLGIVLYNITMIMDAVRKIPNEILNAAYTLGVNRPILLSQVIFPAVLPNILDIMRTNIAGAWNFLILAEVLAAKQGLGFRIIQSGRYVDTDKVLFCICIIGVIGLLTDYALRQLSIALTPWSEHSSL